MEEKNQISDFEIKFESCHPVFEGHFPGTPIVPGVIILENIFRFLEENIINEIIINELEQVKFRAPLLPNQKLRLKFTVLSPNRIKFLGNVQENIVVSGSLLIK